MEITFPEIELYKGWGKPLRTESNVEGLELVEGHLPPELQGTWYRGGADRQYPPMTGDDIFIDGEGMVHMVRFEDGHVTYRSRWVETPPASSCRRNIAAASSDFIATAILPIRWQRGPVPARPIRPCSITRAN